MVLVAIKGGQIIHVGNGVSVIDRVQTGGPGQLNVPTTKIYELGNYKSVATVRDTPDLTFTLESLDCSTEIEQMLVGVTSMPVGGVDLSAAVPIDFASQWKAGRSAPLPYKVTSSVAIPFLYLESLSYRFGLTDNAAQTATFRGDTIFYNPGPCYVETAAGTGSPSQTIVTAQPAYQSADSDGRRVLAVTVGTKRLAFGADYTETYGSVSGGAAVTTIHLSDTYLVGQTIRIIYSSPTTLSYPQVTHPDTTVKPAAVRGRDIEVFVGGYDPLDIPGSQVNKLSSVQSVTVTWAVQLDKDEEFGNHYAVGQDFDVPTVNGSVDIKPRDDVDFRSLLLLVSGVSDATKVIGPSTAVPLALDIVIHDPDTQAVIKRINVDDARFSVPGYSGQVQQKLTVTLPFESDEGDMLVFDA